jgi:dTDP-4-dehydrorhamnose 3,5-epimerase/CDP-3, 6-dideoxy-D-glycero-D-glycero-4-hexulose-5-epimerase
MTIEQTLLNDVFVINNFNVNDERGMFVKTFNKNAFNELNLNFQIKESYFSISKIDVIRGMHFQLPPHDHEKLVFVPKGAIIDVVVDLRKNSPTYKKYISLELSEQNKKSIFIPKGLAHGFKSLFDDTITVYNVATEYNLTSDSGIHYNSFGFDWKVDNPIISQRDFAFVGLNSFLNNNPF